MSNPVLYVRGVGWVRGDGAGKKTIINKSYAKLDQRVVKVEGATFGLAHHENMPI